MKVAFVGKGGSGKTTISSLFARYAAAQNLPVIAIDADINQHMGVALGFEEKELASQPPMGQEIDRIKRFLRGNNRRISSEKTMAKTTPPGNGSKLLKVQEDNPIWEYFGRKKSGVTLLATGPFDKSDLGIKCYHSKTGAVELILNHLIDMPKEYIVQDMTAGADSFASGMFTKFDITFLIAEPTMRGVSVYEQYKQYARGHDINLKVIGNKVEDKEDEEFLQKHVGDNLLGNFNRSQFVRMMEKGTHQDFKQLEKENASVLGLMLQEVDKTRKKWQKFYEHTVEFHVRNAKSWANAQTGEDLTKQVDPSFSFPA